MSFKKYFHHAVRRRYPADAHQLCPAIESRYRDIFSDIAFARKSVNPVDRRLDFTAYFLATIQVLERHGERFEQIRHLCLDITQDYVRPKNRLHAWLKRLPVQIIKSPFGGLIARFMKKKTGRLGHPDGFLVEVITNPAETNGLGYGFDIVECGICKLFQKHGAFKYAAILCEVDKLTSSLAGLELIRSGTIANGAEKCDFRFRVI